MPPIGPSNVRWEQTDTEIRIFITLKYVSLDDIQTYISPLYVKVNAKTDKGHVIWHGDLLHRTVQNQSSWTKVFQEGREVLVRIRLVKEDPTLYWDDLLVEINRDNLAEIEKRRQESIQEHIVSHTDRRAGLDTTRTREEKRLVENQWDIEKKQRNEIIERVQAETAQEKAALAEWEDRIGEELPGRDWSAEGQDGPEHRSRTSSDSLAPMRSRETVELTTSFTMALGKAPARVAHDEEFYYQSAHKPKNAKDTPVHFKKVGDECFKNRQWREAAEAYSEALKRDPGFCNCVCNRAACWLKMYKYDKAVEDCNLALNLIKNTPASQTTAERYKFMMMKMLVRRGTAYAWSGRLALAVADYSSAVKHDVPGTEGVTTDFQYLKQLALEQNISLAREASEASLIKQKADKLVFENEFQEALELYDKAYEMDNKLLQTRTNRVVCLLHLGKFHQAIEDCNALIHQFSDIVTALSSTAATDAEADSDNEDEDDDDVEVRAARTNERLVKRKTATILLLLSTYVRRGTAYCGLRDYASAAQSFEKAIAIRPYDDDLRKDLEKITEKARMSFLTSAVRG